MPSSSSSSLSRLLSQTKISTFDPKINQVYTCPSGFSSRGDWGFSKPIPPLTSSTKRLRYLQLHTLESTSGHTPWSNSESLPRLHKRSQELPIRISTSSNFKSPLPRSIFDKHSFKPLPIENLPSKNETEKDSKRLESKRNSSRFGYGYLYSQNGDLRDVKGTKKDWLGVGGEKEFSYQPNLFPDYNSMSEKQFENWLEGIRRGEHGLKVEGEGAQQVQQSKSTKGSYRSQLEQAEQAERKKKLNTYKNKVYQSSLQAIREAKETGSTPSEDAIYLAQFSSSSEIPDVEFFKRAGTTDMELLGPTSEVDLWDSARKISTHSSSNYLRDSILTSNAEPTSTLLPTGSLTGTSSSTHHQTSGLQYSNPDKIYTSRLAELVKGRSFNAINTRENPSDNQKRSGGRYAVGIAGRIVEVPNMAREGVQNVDWQQGNSDQAIGQFRFSESRLERNDLPSSMASILDGLPYNPNSTEPISGLNLPNRIKSQVYSSFLADNAKHPKNSTVVGNKVWISLNDGVKTSESFKRSGIPVNLKIDYDSRSTPGFANNRNQSRRSVAGQVNASKGTFPYSRAETKVKLDRNSTASIKSVERAEKEHQRQQKDLHKMVGKLSS